MSLPPERPPMARMRSTTSTRSRCCAGSMPCASGRACISATPMTARACTTWSTRSSTTRSTRRSPAIATRSTVTLNADGSCHRHRQRPRHPGRHPRRGRRLGRRGHHDPAPCRRKIRPELLQGLGRAARRRRLGRQRAVRAPRSAHLPRRLGMVHALPRRRARGAARRGRARRRIWPAGSKREGQDRHRDHLPAEHRRPSPRPSSISRRWSTGCASSPF